MLAIKRKMGRFRKVKLDHTFLLLFIFGLISAINLTLYSIFDKDVQNWSYLLLLYIGILFNIYDKRNHIAFVSKFPANFIGFCLVIIPYIKAGFLVEAIWVSWYFIVLISATGLALLASGFPGIKQFQKELAIIFIFPTFVFIFIRLLSVLSSRVSVTLISAKITSFVLWYLGFDSVNQGTIVYVNGGAIDIYDGCTGISLLLMLLRVSITLVILFPFLLKNIYLPFILSFLISGVFSIGRLIIMALVVTDKPAFHYWHGHEGGNIFALLSFLSFGTIILLLSPDNQIPLSPSKVTSRKSQPVSYANLIIGISLIIILFNFWFYYGAKLGQIATYSFPQQIPLPGWQLTSSEPVSIPQKEQNLPQQTRDMEADQMEAGSRDDILSGQIYHYRKTGQDLTVNFYYIPSSSSLGNIQYYYNSLAFLPDLPKLIEPLEKINPKGYHLQFSSGGKNYLTACINSMGKSTATVSQFIAYFYRPYLNPSQWLNLFNGKQTLRDKRCVWGQLSLSKADGSDAELEAVWQTLLSYWQGNFPKLKN
ncbi:archaeosortase/exosortase family protein [Dolichospermum sp. LEGE 00246]|uniref:archaeosortase/exosortase family protein n=1 Tax=Dolichospermum sp. LEGE 00246 TaxID=1828605 RepID=UPI00187F299C|nr:archaeosortase/exosortase family protein [Dolichospermum sp. LEGE 00246]